MMPEDFITRREHEEFEKRMNDENNRQNHRLSKLEAVADSIHSLTVSVGKLATNMESMLKEMDRQGRRLEALEGRDGEMLRSVTIYVVTAVIGIALGFIFNKI